MTEQLFSYGTLQSEAVQFKLFGRKLEGKADTLPGYSLSMLKIEDEDVVATSGQSYHPIISYTGNPEESVDGKVFSLTPEELEQADEYEEEDYQRVSVILRSGTKAWVYIDAR